MPLGSLTGFDYGQIARRPGGELTQWGSLPEYYAWLGRGGGLGDLYREERARYETDPQAYWEWPDPTAQTAPLSFEQQQNILGQAMELVNPLMKFGGMLGTTRKALTGGESIESFHRELLDRPVGSRDVAKAKIAQGEPLTEGEYLALTEGMRKGYRERAMAGMEGPFTHERLTDVPNVPQGPVERYIPPRGGSPQVQKLAGNQRAYEQVLEWARRGMTDEGLGWYNTQELRDAFVRELGPDVGNKRFDRFIDLVASTSAGAQVPENIRIASYYDVLAERGLPAVMPPKGSGYGHKAQHLHRQSSEPFMQGGQGLDPIANPKRYTFAENLRGNWAPTTVDKHNVRAWGIASRDPRWLATKLEDPKNTPKPDWWTARYGEWNPLKFSPQKFAQEHPRFNWDKYPATWFKGAPAKSEYQILEQLNERLARDLGTTPAQAQAALWLGAGDVTGLGSPPLAFAQVFDRVLRQRAAERGSTPQGVLSEFLQGRRPLEAGGAAVGLGGLIGNLQEKDEETVFY